jgi:hypothetical protein
MVEIFLSHYTTRAFTSALITGSGTAIRASKSLPSAPQAALVPRDPAPGGE